MLFQSLEEIFLADSTPMRSGITPSIRKRLLVRIAGVLFVAWAVAAIFTKYLAWDTSSQFLRNQSEQLAQSWIEIVSNPGFMDVPATTKPNQLVIGWRAEQLILNHSPIMLPKPTSDKTIRTEVGEHKWMLSSLCRNTVCVTYGFRDKERKYAIRHYMLVIFLPLLVIFGCSMIAMFFAVKSGLVPLNSLASYLSSKSVNELCSIDRRGADAELVPLIGSINQLVENLQKQLANERHFLDTCAHELRTPVTALLTQLHMLQRNQKGEYQFIDGKKIKNISLSAQRTCRAASQILNLARNANAQLNQSQLQNKVVTFDICELARQVISDILTAYPRLECKMFAQQEITVHADSIAIEMMISNLVENAGRYCRELNGHPAECHISIKLVRNYCRSAEYQSTILFVVEDNGTGVLEEDRQAIFERFYRSNHSSDSESPDGAGLGLSIVQDIATRYDGTAIADESQTLGGLKVSIRLNNIFADESLTYAALHDTS